MFADRADAGRRLAKALARFSGQNPLVLALPRGGVPVGYEVATALGGQLDILLVRKVGAPGQPELAIGAIVDGESIDVVLDHERIAALGVPESLVAQQVRSATDELRRRETLYRGSRPWIPVAGRLVLVVDDGIATGASVRAALQRLARLRPQQLVLAVPVAPPDSLVMLRPYCNLIVCLAEPPYFHAVGQFYDHFDQVSDQQVMDVLKRMPVTRLR